MKKDYQTKNGEYLNLKEKELLWLLKNEKKLPQMNSNNDKLIFIDPNELKKLL